MIRAEYAVGESVEAQRIVISPSNRETERLGKLLQVDHRRTSVDSNRLATVEKFTSVAGGAGDAEHNFLLLGIRIDETIVTSESNRQAVRVLIGRAIRY